MDAVREGSAEMYQGKSLSALLFRLFCSRYLVLAKEDKGKETLLWEANGI